MAVRQVNNVAGTVQLKLGGGQLKQVVGMATGTTYTFQFKDGPDPNGNTQPLIGASAVTVTAGTTYMNPFAPITFRDGLQVVVAGTPGEFEVQFD